MCIRNIIGVILIALIVIVWFGSMFYGFVIENRPKLADKIRGFLLMLSLIIIGTGFSAAIIWLILPC